MIGAKYHRILLEGSNKGLLVGGFNLAVNALDAEVDDAVARIEGLNEARVVLPNGQEFAIDAPAWWSE